MNKHRLSLVLIGLLVGCQGGPVKSSGPAHETGAANPPATQVPSPLGGDSQYLAPEKEPLAWTSAFLQPATLLADRIRIEGPNGLLEHLVVRSDDKYFLRTAKATTAGLLQVTRARSSAGGELVGGQLDRWQLSAFEEISVLIHPGLKEVRVVAEGDAFWRTPNGSEQRGAQLSFTKPVKTP